MRARRGCGATRGRGGKREVTKCNAIILRLVKRVHMVWRRPRSANKDERVASLMASLRFMSTWPGAREVRRPRLFQPAS